MIEIPVSNGELIDKITILTIKSIRINDKAKLKNISLELDKLIVIAEKSLSDYDIENKIALLQKVNEDIWDIEDKIRECEKKSLFDEEFIQLARSVYINNDRRASIKKEIDVLTNSTITEEKSYAKYT